MAYALAALSWIVYNAVGIHKHGLLGYLKLQSVPSGVSPVMYPLLVPLEFFSNILVRPVTLALRLFANMFAGHILLVLFATGGLYLIEHVGGIGYVADVLDEVEPT
ncbi:MAG: F0F1 ATP synthase subunit A, partial [Verrucomicrobiaceae bacterium]